MHYLYHSVFALLLVALTSACSEKPPEIIPEPQELTRDAIGYFCQMTVLDHNGPKGQVFLPGEQQPLVVYLGAGHHRLYPATG